MSEPVKNFVIAAVTRPIVAQTPPSPPPVIRVVEVESLDAMEARLRAELAEVQAKRLVAKREQEARELAEAAERKVVVSVKDFAGSMVIVQSDFRADLLELWKSVPGRMYRGAQDNAIPVEQWLKSVRDTLIGMKNITLMYAPGIEESIHKHMNAPAWLIELEKRRLKLTPGARYNAYVVRDIPGCEWQGYKHADHKFFSVPLSEAWRLFEQLSTVEGVVWTDDAKDFTMRQIEARAILDKIGTAEDWDYDAGFVGDYKLRPFQRVGCAFVEATGGRALLAYEMGLGKTPMSLAYAWKNKLRTIIVCPASLKTNWCRQIFKFTGIKPNVLVGAEPTNHDLVGLLTSPSIFTIINYDILSRKTEYDDVKKDAEGYDHVEHKSRFLWVDAINMSKPDLVIVEESHYIKNTDSNRSQATRLLVSPHVLHLTGTPVMNRPGELWPTLTMLAPDVFPSEDTFINQYTIDGRRAKNVEALRESLKSIMIRRKQSDVRKDLPPKERIIEYHDLSPKAKKLYTKVMMGIYEEIEAFSSKREHGGEHSIANILVRIQRLKQVCAIDKVDRTAELATELHESASEERHNKVLIFSQFKATTFAISQRLGHEALCFVSRGANEFITANDAERDRLVQQFQNDPAIKYLVVTEKTAKEGHDITEAGFVIFNDLFWTPAGHEQGEGRAYMRESDPHDIRSYYLLVDKDSGEIEEWIWELLKMKTDVIAQTVDSVESVRDSGVAMALIEKMKSTMWTRKR